MSVNMNKTVDIRSHMLLVVRSFLAFVSLFSDFHKFVRGRFSEEPEDKKQNIISNIILVSKLHFTFSIPSSLDSVLSLFLGGH